MRHLSWYLKAAAVYTREPCARTFEEDLFLHLLHGTVVSTPRVFAMLRPVWRGWPLERLRDPTQTDAAGDCWWVWLAAGDPGEIFRYGEPKKWVAFERGNSPRYWAYDRLRRFWRASLESGPVRS